MILLDSNIVIYSAKPGFSSLRRLLERETLCVSIVSYVEVLGFHKLTDQDKAEFEQFFAVTQILQISDEIADSAVRLRQMRKIALGDALIAATSLTHNIILVTGNVKDFNWIDGLSVVNPLENE